MTRCVPDNKRPACFCVGLGLLILGIAAISVGCIFAGQGQLEFLGLAIPGGLPTIAGIWMLLKNKQDVTSESGLPDVSGSTDIEGKIADTSEPSVSESGSDHEVDEDTEPSTGIHEEEAQPEDSSHGSPEPKEPERRGTIGGIVVEGAVWSLVDNDLAQTFKETGEEAKGQETPRKQKKQEGGEYCDVQHQHDKVITYGYGIIPENGLGAGAAKPRGNYRVDIVQQCLQNRPNCNYNTERKMQQKRTECREAAKKLHTENAKWREAKKNLRDANERINAVAMGGVLEELKETIKNSNYKNTKP